MINATTRLIAPPDVEVVPVSELEDELRERLAAESGSFAVHRPIGRASPKLISADTAGLFRQFSEPRSIPEAIVAFAATRGVDASTLVTAAIEAIADLVNVGYLVDAEGPSAVGLTATLRADDTVGAFRIHSVVRVMGDVDVYQAVDAQGGRAALKLWRQGGHDEAAHEAHVLRHLAGRAAPGLLGVGLETPVYLATRWCSGVVSETAAAELQLLPGPARRECLVALLATVSATYRELHALGVLHGDVHDENLFVGRDGAITLLDFAQSTCSLGGEVRQPATRGGYFRYFEPEYAVARLEQRALPHATPASEQYALAAMFFHWVTGSHYLDLAPQEAAALRQIVEAVPLSFAAVGAEPWPELERILGRALQKAPEDRYPSVEILASELRMLEQSEGTRRHSRARRPSRAVDRVTGFWAETAPGGRLFERGFVDAPTCSIAFGAAGVAYALYRYAQHTGSADWLSLAAHWAEVARQGLPLRQALYDDDELTPDTVGRESVLNGAAGAHLVVAMCSNAMGDEYGARSATSSFLRVTRRRSRDIDVALGSAGEVLALTMLADMFAANTWMKPTGLIARARATARHIWDRLDACDTVGRDAELPNLGISHGWAGFLYATLRLRRLGVLEFDERLRRRLRELADCGEYSGRGMRWPWRDVGSREEGNYTGGWCNGSAGLAHLWLEAEPLLGVTASRDLAAAAAWNALDAADDEVPGLCCGLAGSAYALLAMYRASGEEHWWRRATELAHRAATACSTDFPEYHSFFRGVPGVALLVAELEAPYAARMPVFESEDWSIKS